MTPEEWAGEIERRRAAECDTPGEYVTPNRDRDAIHGRIQAEVIRAAVEKEREACAKLCDQPAERPQAATDHCMQWAATAFKRQAEIIRAPSKD
jgi:hypothetical protein